MISIQHFQGKQSKPETHQYFKQGSFGKNVAEIECNITKMSHKRALCTVHDAQRFRQTDSFPLYEDIGFNVTQI